MTTELIHVGFNNVLAINRVIAIVAPNSAPTKRLIQQGKENHLTVDMTSGRRTKAVLIMDSGHIVLAAITPETIRKRVGEMHEDSGSLRMLQNEGEGE